MNKTRNQRNEAVQLKIKGVLEALGRPVKSSELIVHPILAGENFSGQRIGAHLRFLQVKKLIRKTKRNMWAPLTTRTAVSVPETKELPKMYFVLIPSEQKILLDVGGMRLPVVIE